MSEPVAAAHDPRRAVAAMLGAAALIAATSLIAKGLGGAWTAALHPLQVSAGRFGFALLALGLVLALKPSLRPPMRGIGWRTHLARSLCGWGGVTCLFAAAARMPLAEATALSFLSPLVTIALAALMLGERAGLRTLLSAALSAAGAILLLRPGAEAVQSTALLALAAAGLFGLEAIFIKRLADAEPRVQILLVNYAIGAAVALPVAALVWTPPGASGWGLLALLGAVMVSGQALFVEAMRRGRAGAVIPAFYTTLVFAALYDLAAFGTALGPVSTAGCALILLGALAAGRGAGGGARPSPDAPAPSRRPAPRASRPPR